MRTGVERIILAALTVAIFYWQLFAPTGSPEVAGNPAATADLERARAEKVKELISQHRYAEALKPCMQLREDYPENHIYVEQLAIIYENLPDLPKAAAMWERYIDQSPTPSDGCPRLTRVYMRLGQFEKSIDAARRCTELEPQNPDLIFELAHAHEISQHLDEAERLYREGAALAPDNDDFRIGQGRLRLRQGKPAEAQTAAEAVLRRAPRNSDALLLLGLACWRQGEIPKAKHAGTHRRKRTQPGGGVNAIRPRAGAGSDQLRGAGAEEGARRSRTMIRSTPVLLVARLLYAVFVLLTAIYGVLAYLPFTFHQIVQGGLLPWLSAFADYHPLCFWLALGILAPSLLAEDRRGRAAWSFLGVHALAALMLTLRPVLAHAGNSLSSLLFASAALLSLVWLAALEWRSCGADVDWPEHNDQGISRLFQAVWQSAVLLACSYAGVVWIRELLLQRTAPETKMQAAGLVRSLDAHVVVFAGGFALAVLLTLLAGLLRNSGLWEFVFHAGAAMAVMSQVLVHVIFPTVSFDGLPAQLFAGWIAFVLVAFWTALSARLAARGAWAGTGLELLLLPLVFWFGDRRWPRRVVLGVGLPVVLLAAWLVTVNAAAMDWNYVAQKSSALVLWLLTFAAIYRLTRSGMRRSIPPTNCCGSCFRSRRWTRATTSS
ncbi:MAG: tetratricopeptide repeat protein [Acidobacteria bacterium]|nr:tetratricopeptide repeat protein [Acidobacteriota bacterium]